jgi:hypothetical protein
MADRWSSWKPEAVNLCETVKVLGLLQLMSLDGPIASASWYSTVLARLVLLVVLPGGISTGTSTVVVR